MDSLQLLKAYFHLVSTKELNALDTWLCQACLAGKLHRSSFPERRSCSITTPLARIHMDIKDPLPLSIGGALLQPLNPADRRRMHLIVRFKGGIDDC